MVVDSTFIWNEFILHDCCANPPMFHVLLYIVHLPRVGRYHEWMTMGALYWQLNDVWVAPSWSSIEYNGNFKVEQRHLLNLILNLIHQIHFSKIMYEVENRPALPAKISSIASQSLLASVKLLICTFHSVVFLARLFHLVGLNSL